MVAPLVASAMISGAGGILGGMFQASADKKNRQWVQDRTLEAEQRAYTYQLAAEGRQMAAVREQREYEAAWEQSQRAYNERLWQDQLRVDAAARNESRDYAARMQAEDRAYLEAREAGQIERIRDAAIKAGFNPLTVLGSTAGGGFGGGHAPGPFMSGGSASQVMGAGSAPGGLNFSAAAVPGYQASYTPVMSSGAFLADSISATAASYFNQKAEQDFELQRIAYQGQVDAANRAMVQNTVPRDFGYSLTAPARVTAPVRETFGPPSPAVMVPEPRLDQGTGVYGEGSRMQPTPGWSPATVFEEEYGDVGGSLYGVVKFGRDLWHNGRIRYDNWVMAQGAKVPPMWKSGNLRFDPNHRDGYYGYQ